MGGRNDAPAGSLVGGRDLSKLAGVPGYRAGSEVLNLDADLCGLPDNLAPAVNSRYRFVQADIHATARR